MTGPLATTRLAARMTTAEAMILLPLARALVDLVPLKRWRKTLGTTGSNISGNANSHHNFENSPSIEAKAARLAAHIERGATRLPLHTKCLPRAVALQWMLRRRGIDAAIVIAVRPGENRDAHDYHAWVEREGTMLIGHCDRTQYRPLMTLTTSRPAAQAG